MFGVFNKIYFNSSDFHHSFPQTSFQASKETFCISQPLLMKENSPTNPTDHHHHHHHSHNFKTCCTLKMEKEMSETGLKELREMSSHVIASLKHKFESSYFSYKDHFRKVFAELIELSKNLSSHVPFLPPSSIPQLMEALVSSSEKFLFHSETPSHQILHHYFKKLFSNFYFYIIQDHNPEEPLQSVHCIEKHRSSTFDYLVNNFSQLYEDTLNHSSFLLSQLRFSISIIQQSSNISFTPQCPKQIAFLSVCGVCRGHVDLPRPCLNLVRKVLIECTIEGFDLVRDWKDFVKNLKMFHEFLDRYMDLDLITKSLLFRTHEFLNLFLEQASSIHSMLSTSCKSHIDQKVKLRNFDDLKKKTSSSKKLISNLYKELIKRYNHAHHSTSQHHTFHQSPSNNIFSSEKNGLDLLKQDESNIKNSENLEGKQKPFNKIIEQTLLKPLKSNFLRQKAIHLQSLAIWSWAEVYKNISDSISHRPDNLHNNLDYAFNHHSFGGKKERVSHTFQPENCWNGSAVDKFTEPFMDPLQRRPPRLDSVAKNLRVQIQHLTKEISLKIQQSSSKYEEEEEEEEQEEEEQDYYEDEGSGFDYYSNIDDNYYYDIDNGEEKVREEGSYLSGYEDLDEDDEDPNNLSSGFYGSGSGYEDYDDYEDFSGNESLSFSGKDISFLETISTISTTTSSTTITTAKTTTATTSLVKKHFTTPSHSYKSSSCFIFNFVVSFISVFVIINH